ncbi:TrkA C-terminal domain-containing protein, partial [Helicobacter typhlonius]|uniref:TrkA C-terminal domain-containing protein n=1 Tax=Helicobacter typhlonius TaxID=76936 RepID=UPI002FE1C642
AEPNTVLQTEDILYVKGDFGQVSIWAAEHRLELLDSSSTEDTRADSALDFYDIGIAEIVLMPASRIVNHTIKEIGFRDKFNVNVLGIRRKIVKKHTNESAKRHYRIFFTYFHTLITKKCLAGGYKCAHKGTLQY